MPATDPACPFLEHAPSVYTTSSNPVDDEEDLVGFDGPALTLDDASDRPARGSDSDSETAAGVDANSGEEDDTCVGVLEALV